MHRLLRALAPHHAKLETLIILALAPITLVTILIQVPFGPVFFLAIFMVLLLSSIALVPQIRLTPKAQPSRSALALAFLSRSAARMYGRLRLP